MGVDIMEDSRTRGPLSESGRKDFWAFVRDTLSAKERYILTMYYGDDLTLKEIGDILGLSESRVCQIHAKVVVKLRAYMIKKRGEWA